MWMIYETGICYDGPASMHIRSLKAILCELEHVAPIYKTSDVSADTDCSQIQLQMLMLSACAPRPKAQHTETILPQNPQALETVLP